MVFIPEGWFGMGCEAGRDDEKPPAPRLGAHIRNSRVPGNSRRVRALPCRHDRPRARRFGTTPISSSPDQPVVGPSWFDAEAFCNWLSEVSGRVFRLPSEAECGNAPRAAAWRARSIPGAMPRRGTLPRLRRALEDRPRALSPPTRQTRVWRSFTWATTSTNGAVRPWYEPRYYEHSAASAIRTVLRRAAVARRAAVRGVIRSARRAARDAPAFPLNSSTPITAFA